MVTAEHDVVFAVGNVEMDGRGPENVPCVGEGELDIRSNVRGGIPVNINNVLHAHANVFHVVGRALSFRTADLEVVRLKQEHEVTGGRCTIHRASVSVLEEDREHAGMVKMRVRQDNGVQLIQRQGFWSVEERHGVGIGSNVHANIDHDSRLIGRDIMARTSDFPIGAKGCHSGP